MFWKGKRGGKKAEVIRSLSCLGSSCEFVDKFVLTFVVSYFTSKLFIFLCKLLKKKNLGEYCE